VAAAASSPAELPGLTRAELSVTRLIATVMTHREVADGLYMPVKTVEYHLRNGYIKPDITSRRLLGGRTVTRHRPGALPAETRGEPRVVP
jgi:DNA-binding CsgD family transcriptional regulator